MAVSSKFTQKSLVGGGSTKSMIPNIDTSYGANLGIGQQQNNIVKLPTLLEDNNNSDFAVTNKNTTQNLIGETLKVTIPKYLTYQNNLDNVANFIGQGGSNKGITDEGVIIGNPNVENMPTINRGEVTSKPLVSYNDQLLAAAENIELPVSVQQTHSLNSNSGFPTEVIGGTNQDETLGIPMIGNNHTETGSVTDSTDITGDSGLGGTTTSGNKVDTYEEFLLKQEGFYKEQLDKLNAQIEQNKQNALQQAESERERAVIDARSSYAQNLATYGANAEQLAAMGLSGSGYSDYLNQQAYATQRAETQNANAQAEATKLAAEQQANSDKLNAELSYAENMQGNAEKLAQYQQQKTDEAKVDEEQKYQNYLTVLDAAKSGNYTSEEIAQIAQNYGFDEAMVESLTNAASTAQSDQKTDSTTEYYAALLASANSGKYTSEQIASLGAQYGLDEAQISQLQAAAESYEKQKYADNYATILDQMLSELPYYNDDNKLVIKEQDRNKMLEFLEENKDSLGEQLYDFYKKQVDNIEIYSEQAQKDDETAKQEEQQKEEDKQIITGIDSIEYNGKYYRLDSQLDKGANQIVRNNDFKDKLKELGYSDPFDKNIPNGTTIKSNVDNKGANDFNWWDDVGAFLLSPFGAGAWDSWGNWNEITMTYYNGNWYLSSEV